MQKEIRLYIRFVNPNNFDNWSEKKETRNLSVSREKSNFIKRLQKQTANFINLSHKQLYKKAVRILSNDNSKDNCKFHKTTMEKNEFHQMIVEKKIMKFNQA